VNFDENRSKTNTNQNGILFMKMFCHICTLNLVLAISLYLVFKTFRHGNCEMVSSRRPCFYASIWKILQKQLSHFRLCTIGAFLITLPSIGGEWCLLLRQPPLPFGMICFGSCNQ